MSNPGPRGELMGKKTSDNSTFNLFIVPFLDSLRTFRDLRLEFYSPLLTTTLYCVVIISGGFLDCLYSL